MKASVRLDLGCSTEAVRRSLVEVLSPDNKDIPRGMRLSMRGSGRALKFELRSETAQNAVSTCLSILQDVALFEQVWLLSTAADGRSSETMKN